MVDLTALILAGGKSSRMGTDKALLVVKEQPLLRQVCQVAQGVAQKVYVVTPWGERYSEIVPKGCEIIQEVSLPADTHFSCPLFGFTQGLAQVKTDWVLLLACDLPRLDTPEVQKWVTYLEDISEDPLALLPRHSKGWEPLCGFYRRQCLPLLQDYIQQGGRSFQGWLAQHSVAELRVTDFSLLFNCNTPADLEEAITVNGQQ